MRKTAENFISKTSLATLLRRLRESAFFKNTLVVMSGTAIAQVLGFGLSPIISRLFTPSDFGVFGSFTAVSTIIAAGATLEYSQAIMLPKEREHAINLLVLAFLCTLVISFLCAVVCLLFPITVSALLKTKGTWALALLTLSTLVAGINQACQAWSIRAKAFKHTSASQVIRSITSNGTKIGFGILQSGSVGLIISNILANISASINLTRVLLPDLNLLRNNIRWRLIKQLAKEYHDFPLYSASQNVINALSGGLPVLLLTHYYGISIAGAYAFGISMLQVPMGFVLTALRQVLFQKACESQHRGQSLASLYIKITAGLFAVVSLPSIILTIWAPQLFSWLFGKQWRTAGEFARGLVIWLAVAFCNLPAILFARIIRKQRFLFFYDMTLLAARALALILGGLFLSALQTVTLFALIGAIMNAYLIYWIGRAVIEKEGMLSLDSFRDYLTRS